MLIVMIIIIIATMIIRVPRMHHLFSQFSNHFLMLYLLLLIPNIMKHLLSDLYYWNGRWLNYVVNLRFYRIDWRIEDVLLSEDEVRYFRKFSHFFECFIMGL